MPFWKQSEDPWDRKPDKPRAEPKDLQANPLDSLKAWNEERKAKEKEKAKSLPPEPCPWCGKDMEQGFLFGGRDGVRWHPGVYKYEFLRRLDSRGLDLLDEGSIWSGLYKTTWLCRDCKKAVFTIPEPLMYGDSFSAHVAEYSEKTKEEEESEE